LNSVITPGAIPGQSLYVSPGSPNWDYHLNKNFRGGNPAIGAATGSSTTSDLDNNPREGTPDLGAFEAVRPRIELSGPVVVTAGGKAAITITRIGDPSDPVNVLITVAGGSAVAGTDFQAIGANGVVTFGPLETTRTLVIQTNPGAANAPDKTINLTLS